MRKSKNVLLFFHSWIILHKSGHMVHAWMNNFFFASFLRFLPLWVVDCWLLLYLYQHIRHRMQYCYYYLFIFVHCSSAYQLLYGSCLYSVHLLWFYILFPAVLFFLAGFAATEIMCWWNIICMRNIRWNIGRTFAHQLIRFTTNTCLQVSYSFRSNFLFRFCMTLHIGIYGIIFALALDVEFSLWCVHRNRQRRRATADGGIWNMHINMFWRNVLTFASEYIKRARTWKKQRRNEK